MPIDVTMPKLSDTMEEGKILKWLKRPGEPVAIGEIIAEVETDKANMELEAYDEGTLAEVRVQEGDSAPVGAVIAVLAARGEGTTAQRVAREKAAPSARAPASAPRAAAPAKVEAGREPFRPTVVRRPEPVESPGAAASVKASPLARRIAHDHDLDLAQVTGTGPGGRIVQKDVKAALAALEGEYEGLTYTHVVLKAVGLALTRVPELNASYDGDAMVLHEAVNVGVATAVDDGLVVPVVRHCDREPLAAIVRQARGLLERARSGRFASDDLTGATFTLSNLGMLPVTEFTAVINPPQAAILAVGTIRETPVVREGQIVPGRRMTVTVSCDHRIIDGMLAGRFLRELKGLLENPLALVL